MAYPFWTTYTPGFIFKDPADCGQVVKRDIMIGDYRRVCWRVSGILAWQVGELEPM